MLLFAGHQKESKLGCVGRVLKELGGSWLIGPGSFLTPVSLLLLGKLLLLAELVQGLKARGGVDLFWPGHPLLPTELLLPSELLLIGELLPGLLLSDLLLPGDSLLVDNAS